MNSIQSSGFAVDKIKSMMIFHTCDAFTVWRFYVALSWRGGTTGRALDLRSTDQQSGVQILIGTTLGKLFTPVCLCHQTV